MQTVPKTQPPEADPPEVEPSEAEPSKADLPAVPDEHAALCFDAWDRFCLTAATRDRLGALGYEVCTRPVGGPAAGAAL